MLLNCGVGEDSWESLGLQGDPSNPSKRRSVLDVHWKDWCWSWNSNTLATWWEELTHLKRPWCWEGLGAGGEGDNRGWDGWMASLTRWTWIWVNSRSWWWTGRAGVLLFRVLQRVGHDWEIELNWTEYCHYSVKDMHVKSVWNSNKDAIPYIINYRSRFQNTTACLQGIPNWETERLGVNSLASVLGISSKFARYF